MLCVDHQRLAFLPVRDRDLPRRHHRGSAGRDRRRTVDGAGFWRRNYQIILPMILPIMAIGLIFGIVFTFTDLSIVFLLTQGGPVGATSVLGFAAFRPASFPATCRTAPPSRCSCCRCCSSW
jgi:hypothetical protein